MTLPTLLTNLKKIQRRTSETLPRNVRTTLTKKKNSSKEVVQDHDQENRHRDMEEGIAMSVTEEMDHCGRGVLILEERTSQTTAMQVTRNVMVAEKSVITYGYAQ